MDVYVHLCVRVPFIIELQLMGFIGWPVCSLQAGGTTDEAADKLFAS